MKTEPWLLQKTLSRYAIRLVASSNHINIAHRNRRSTSLYKISGQDRNGPGVRKQFPGTVIQTKHKLRRAVKQAEQSADVQHGNIKKPGEAAGQLPAHPHPSEFPRCPRAEIQ